MSPYYGIVNDYRIHSSSQETVQRLLRRIDNRLVLVEARIEYHRHSGKCRKFADEPVISRISARAYGLEAAASIGVSDGWKYRSLLGPNRVYLLHEGVGSSADEIVVHRAFQYRWGERAKLLPELYLEIDDVPHVAASRVSENAAVPKGAGTPFHAPLVPSHDVAIGD